MLSEAACDQGRTFAWPHRSAKRGIRAVRHGIRMEDNRDSRRASARCASARCDSTRCASTRCDSTRCDSTRTTTSTCRERRQRECRDAGSDVGVKIAQIAETACSSHFSQLRRIEELPKDDGIARLFGLVNGATLVPDVPQHVDFSRRQSGVHERPSVGCVPAPTFRLGQPRKVARSLCQSSPRIVERDDA